MLVTNFIPWPQHLLVLVVNITPLMTLSLFPVMSDSSSQAILDLVNSTLDDLNAGSEAAKALATAKEIGHMMVQDLSYTWPYIVAAFSLAMVLCLVYIVLMRWFAGIMVWVSIAGVVGLLSYCIYVTYVKFVDLRDNPISQAEKESLGEVDSLLALKNTWLVFLIISAVTLVIVLLILLFLRKRINVAVALIKEGSKAVGSITSTLIFPLVPWVLECGVVAYSIATALYLASCSDPVYKITGVTNTSCVCPEIKDGDICDLNIFNVTTNCTGTCIGVSCQFFRYQTPRTIDYLHAVNIFGFFWGLFFVSALGEMILAATFATWYWTFHKSNVPFFTLTISAGRTLRYHLGTLAFGSLILAICRIIRVILEYVNHKLSKYDNVVVKACMCCLRCFFWCLEKFIKFINRNAYIMCAIHGKNFCRSAKDAFNLLMRNVVRVFVVDKVTDFLLFLGKLMITAGVVALAFFVFDGQVTIPETKLPTLNYYLLPVIIIAVGTYFIACLFFNVYAMAVDTLFLCFLEDCERNDGSLEKPYFMSKSLMKVLHKKNKKD
uniref:Choline transporter-like protein n=1 Tax=Timema poppense TaxID=170557 RepID=A0A7R9GYG5_TIMPO|nr:unnamed protein product [Timema poppensis]